MSDFRVRSANCTAHTDPASAVCTYTVKAKDGRTHTGTMTTCVPPMDDGTRVLEPSKAVLALAARGGRLAQAMAERRAQRCSGHPVGLVSICT